MPSDSRHLQIGCLVYEGLDPIDLVGPLEVLSRLSNATCQLFGVVPGPLRTMNGLRLFPDAVLADAAPLDVLLVPGGFGQEALMDNAIVLEWISRQAAGSTCVFSVCTGALLCGAAGLLRGRRATTHWSALHLLPCFGAVAVNQRVVRDGRMLFAAGVTAGMDAALQLAADLRGEEEAQTIQLHMAYAPEPPFNSGTPETAPPRVLEAARSSVHKLTLQRAETARRVAARLEIVMPAILSR